MINFKSSVAIFSVTALGILLPSCSLFNKKSPEPEFNEPAKTASNTVESVKPSMPPRSPMMAAKPMTAPMMLKAPYDLSENASLTTSRKLTGKSQGVTVKGMGRTSGKVAGVAASNSPFLNLRIGMSYEEVIKTVGEPSVSGDYPKDWPPVPHHEKRSARAKQLVYSGLGRLVFVPMGKGKTAEMRLVWIIHNAQESNSL